MPISGMAWVRGVGAAAHVCDVEEDRFLGRGSGNEAKLLARQGGTAHQLNQVATVARQRAMSAIFSVVPTNIQHGDAGGLKLSDFDSPGT